MNMGRICTSCGCIVEEKAKFCEECGAELQTVRQEVSGNTNVEMSKINMYQSKPAVNMYTSNANIQPNSSGGNAMAIISLIAGIISIVSFGCFFIPQIVAVVCAVLSKKNNGRMNELAVAGFVTGIIGASLGFLIIIICLFG